MKNIIPLAKEYWYLPVFVVLLVVYLLKKKKVEPENQDQEGSRILLEQGIKDIQAQNGYKSITAQIAKNLGTLYPKYDPRHWGENDEEVYNLMAPLGISEFRIVSDLYFENYAKGRSLSEDLAKLLDQKYYQLLKVK